jgi:hypothetical protein
LQTAIAVASVIIALVATGVTWRVYTYQRRQNQLALALALHQDLTTGEVAAARDVIGTLWYADEPTRGPVTNKEVLTAYFTILWCFERIYAGDRTMRANSWWLSRSNRHTSPPLDFLHRMIHWHVREWASYIVQIRGLIRARFGRYPDDKYSRAGLTKLTLILQAAGYDMSRLKAPIRSPRVAGDIVTASQRYASPLKTQAAPAQRQTRAACWPSP